VDKSCNDLSPETVASEGSPESGSESVIVTATVTATAAATAAAETATAETVAHNDSVQITITVLPPPLPANALFVRVPLCAAAVCSDLDYLLALAVSAVVQHARTCVPNTVTGDTAPESAAQLWQRVSPVFQLPAAADVADAYVRSEKLGQTAASQGDNRSCECSSASANAVAYATRRLTSLRAGASALSQQPDLWRHLGRALAAAGAFSTATTPTQLTNDESNCADVAKVINRSAAASSAAAAPPIVTNVGNGAFIAVPTGAPVTKTGVLTSDATHAESTVTTETLPPTHKVRLCPFISPTRSQVTSGLRTPS